MHILTGTEILSSTAEAVIIEHLEAIATAEQQRREAMQQQYESDTMVNDFVARYGPGSQS